MSEKKGPVSMVPVISHTVLLQAHCAVDQKQQLFWPKPGSVLATTPASARPVSSLLLFPSLAEWCWLIVLSEKAKPVRAFSSLISQVQSSSLWAGNYIWREKEWVVATEWSNRRSFSKADNRSKVTKHGHLPAGSVHSTMLACRCTQHHNDLMQYALLHILGKPH